MSNFSGKYGTLQGMRTVIMGMGIPGSGKTTYLKPLAERYGFTYVSPDEIRAELTGSATDQSRDEDVWTLARARIAQALEGNASVVMDATFSITRYRAEFVDFLREAGAHMVIGIVAEVELETALERNQSRDRVVPREVVERMHASFIKEPPSLEDGFDALFTLDEFVELEGKLLG
ncbi:MAG: ATP-binding protein [Patescibacteria group bacterium]